MPTPSRTTAALLLALLGLLAAVGPASGAPPLRPDPSFGKRGVAKPQFPPHHDQTSFLAMSVQPDGSLLAARHEGGNGSELLTYRRYDAAGGLDRTVEPQWEIPPVETVGADGKVLRANYNAIERFNPDGSRDLSYGIDPANGKPYSQVLPFRIEKLLPAGSDKLFVAGSIRTRHQGEEIVEEIMVARLDQQGRLDPAFGGDGLVKLPSEAGVAGQGLVGVSGHGEEGIVLLVNEAAPRSYEGEAVTPGGSTVLALAADGRPDAGYGDGGLVRSPSSIEAFAALPDGTLVLTGNSWGAEIGDEGARMSDLYAARLNPAGQYDPGFGGDGIVTADFGGVDLSGALLTSPDGSVLIGGSSTEVGDGKCVAYEGFCRETPVLARFLASGAPDPGFEDGGRVRLGALSEPFVALAAGRGVRAFTALPGGGALAGGGSGTVAFIAKLEPNGALAAGFGSGGIVTERDSEPNETQAHAVAIDSRRRILVAGNTDADAVYSVENGVVFRFLPDGRLDRSYGDGSGYVRVPGNTRDIAVGPEGDAFVLSGEYAPNLVVHVTAGGAVDRRFGEDGVAPLPELPDVRRHGKRHWREFDPRSLATLPGGGVVVGGEGGNGAETRIVLVRYDGRGRLDPDFGRGGVAILAMGRTGQCNVTQLGVRRDGRILIAGRVRERGEHGRRPALVQLLSDGSPDPSFGHRGLVRVNVQTEGVATSLAIQRDGAILLGGRQETPAGRTKPLLLRFSRNGALDRPFARRMRASWPSIGPHDQIEPRQILPTARRIFTIAPGVPILAFSRHGALRASMPFEPMRKPRRSLIAGALQAGRPLLVGQIGESRGLILRRYLAPKRSR